MTDAEKIMLAGFANEMEKDAALPGVLATGLKKGKSLWKAFKGGVTNNPLVKTKGKTTSAIGKQRQTAHNFGKKLYDNKRNIAIGGGSALGGAGLNELLSD